MCMELRGRSNHTVLKMLFIYFFFFGLNLIKNILLGNLLPVNLHFWNVRIGEKNSTDTNHKRLFRKAIMSLCVIFLTPHYIPIKANEKKRKHGSYLSVMNISF